MAQKQWILWLRKMAKKMDFMVEKKWLKKWILWLRKYGSTNG